MEDLLNKALVAKNGLEEQRAEVLGVIVNKVRQNTLEGAAV